eukprot:CAMPEP_0183353242 /NCGR_PEP_ID=MMETSP0164_2-20130417/33146_1 /TAXON_ID=221442 /ORGANISM="Coccolithus pelagicus ssp braarudi, Strain PLY182g" /LENGTH=313 /DNA_ID=CAMNT_0025525891 /DNA_START=14 /DNA_END=956 /DNA_ORIENTATION=+
MRVGRTGNQYISGLNALTIAACCASAGKLPEVHFERTLPRPTCVHFDFSHLVAEHSALCELLPMRRAAEGYWPLSESQTYRACAARNRIAGRAAMRTYAMLDSSHCPVTIEAGRRRAPLGDALVMQIRSSDIFKATLGAAMYQQPPLEFYLDAWERSGKAWAIAVAEDDSNPVMRMLARLQTKMPRLLVLMGRRWHDDLRLLLCAAHIALAHSTLRYFLEDQPRESVYTHAFHGAAAALRSRPAHIRNWSVWDDPGGRERWRASADQLLRLLRVTGKGRWRALQQPLVEVADTGVETLSAWRTSGDGDARQPE